MLLETVAAELRESDRLLTDSTVSSSELQRGADTSAVLLAQVLAWLSATPLTSPQLTQLVHETDRLREAADALTLKLKTQQTVEVEMERTYRLLDLLNHTVESSRSLFPLSLQPAIDECKALEVRFWFYSLLFLLG